MSVPLSRTMVIILFVTIYMLIANLCCGTGQNAADTADTDSIDLIYGYRHTESFMQEHLQAYLWDKHQLRVRIDYDSSLRYDSRSWLTDRAKLLAASGACSVHAYSLPNAFSWSLHWYNGKDLFRPITSDELEAYAPKYYAKVQKAKEGDRLHRPNRSGPWYALTGYRYYYERNVYHLATTDSGIQELGLSTDREIFPHSQANPILSLFNSGTVELSTLDKVLRTIAAQTGQRPLVVWNDFEASFAPLYSAFGIGTVGSNLTKPPSITQPFIIEDVPAQISSAFKEFLQLLFDWYSAGIIDPKFLSMSPFDVAILTAENIARAREDDQRSYSFVSAAYSDATIFPAAVLDSVLKTAEQASLFQVVKDDYTIWSRSRSPFVFAEAYAMCVEDQQIEPLLRLFEYTRSPSSPGWVERVFGLENQHHRVLDKRILPYLVRTVTPRLPPHWQDDELALWHFKRFPEITLNSSHETVYSAVYNFEVTEPWSQLDVEFSGGPIRSSRDSASVFDALQDYAASSSLADLQELSSVLAGITEEYVFRWITGEGAIESEWADYVQMWTESGGHALIEAIGSASPSN